MAGEARVATSPWRRLARLLIGHNKLRRPADRIEGAMVVLLLALFLAAVAAAPIFGAAGSAARPQPAGSAGGRPSA